jgi:hypothetical protein
LLGRVGGGGGGGLHKDPVQLDAGPMLSPAWAGWKCFECELEVEAANGVPYCRSMLRAVKMSSEVYSSCGGEGLRCNVLYQRRSLNFQDLYRVKPLEILTSREKKGRLEAWRIPDIESLVDAVDSVHHFLILLFHSWSTPHITAGQL